jgi:hypothetical protein
MGFLKEINYHDNINTTKKKFECVFMDLNLLSITSNILAPTSNILCITTNCNCSYQHVNLFNESDNKFSKLDEDYWTSMFNAGCIIKSSILKIFYLLMP